MNETIYEAFIVLLVGMITVFIILSLVVISGYYMIRFLNRADFVLNRADASTSAQFSAGAFTDQENSAVIKKAIEQWAGGSAEVININKTSSN